MTTDWDFDEAVAEQHVTSEGGNHAAALAPVAPVQLFPIPLGQMAPTPEPEPSLLARRFLGLPAWAWGVGILAAGGAGYYYYSQKLASNDGEEPDADESSSTGAAEDGGGFTTSRSAMGDKIRAWLDKRGLGTQVTVFTDADEAKKRLKQVSPLITLKSTTTIPIAELDKVCRRDGLMLIEHDGGVVGLYPTTSRRGKAWEKYIDDLRDEGQTV